VNTNGLRPTASREALFEDDLLSSVRQRLGEQIRLFLLDLSATDPDRLAAFLRVHHLGVKAMAVRDEEMLRLVDAWLPFSTNRGLMPLGQFRRGLTMIRYTATVDEFRSLSAIATAAGVPLVNAGYAHDSEILERLSRIDPELSVRRLDPGELAARFSPLPPALESDLSGFLDCAREALDELGCVPRLREFDPATVPALYVCRDDARGQAAVRQAIEVSDELWADVVSAFADVEVDHRPELVLNWRHPLIRMIVGYPPGPLLRHAVQALYGQSLLASHRPLRAADSAALNRAFLVLLDRAFRGSAGDSEVGDGEVGDGDVGRGRVADGDPTDGGPAPGVDR
jgi:molecular chaperone HtpG